MCYSVYMKNAINECYNAVILALKDYAKQKGLPQDTIKEGSFVLQATPDATMGDFGVPVFSLAKVFKMSPSAIAKEVVQSLPPIDAGSFLAVGPYINIKLNKAYQVTYILDLIATQGANYGFVDTAGQPLENKKIMIEFSSPNTNKPLHLGHLRNDALGESISRLLKSIGNTVQKVNIINDRGVHICKSMLAYQKFFAPQNKTPETTGQKSDHFVGDCYVTFDKWSKQDETADKQAQELLEKWEKGDKEVHALWQKMNSWAIEGIKQTYKTTGVSFDKLYFESQTYLEGKDQIYKGLENGIFFRAADGSVRCDVTSVTGKTRQGTNQEKVLLRGDGTSVYITQDIGTAIMRHKDFAFDSLIYVVASEQNYHFKILFYILGLLGFNWAKNLYHLSYGLVNLPQGRMKSREGTVVDADDLIDTLKTAALEQIKQKNRTDSLSNAQETATKIALGALHYYLLQTSPIKDMLFRPEESLSFSGNTGPYLQYMGARLSSILKKAQEQKIEPLPIKQAGEHLTDAASWALIKILGQYPNVIKKAAYSFDPSELTTYLHDLAQSFSCFYRDCPILSADNVDTKRARLLLCKCVLQVLKSGMQIVLVPFLDAM